jgi:hypothetical protein
MFHPLLILVAGISSAMAGPASEPSLEAAVRASQGARAACERFESEVGRLGRPATRADAEAMLALVQGYPGTPAAAQQAMEIALASPPPDERDERPIEALWDVYPCRIAAFHQAARLALETRDLLARPSVQALGAALRARLRSEARGPAFLIQALVLSDLGLRLADAGLLISAADLAPRFAALKERAIEAHEELARDHTLLRELRASSAILAELRALSGGSG